jgi:hypothetical protein
MSSSLLGILAVTVIAAAGVPAPSVAAEAEEPHLDTASTPATSADELEEVARLY